MRTVIVGHGPSLLNAGRGCEIDAYDNVVRMKNFTRFWNEKDYGNKLDYLVASTEAAGPSLANHIKPKQYWLYPKKGTYNKPYVDGLYRGLPTIITMTLSRHWNREFQGRSGYDPKKDPVKGRNVSTGFAALFSAVQLLDLREIDLIGFDTLADPSIEYESTFNPGTTHKNMHYWHIEHDMIPLVEKEYNCKVNFI